MATIHTQVATTGGSLVRGLEVRIGTGPQGGTDAARGLLQRVGGEAKLQELQHRFELRLVSRSGHQFLQLREKTSFGALKALLHQSTRIRQDQERQGAQALLRTLGASGHALAQKAEAGFRPIPLRPAPTAAPAPIFQPLVVAPAPKAPPPIMAHAPAPPPKAVPAPVAPASPAPIAPTSNAGAPLQAQPAVAAAPVHSSGVDKPLIIRKWETVASSMSPLQLVATLDPWELSDLLTKGEITHKTYQQALDRMKDQGRLAARDHAFHQKSLPASMPDPASVGVDKLRARFVREKVQVELFRDLPMKHVFSLGLNGEISDRAYRQIYKEQARKGKLDEQSKVVWKNLDAPASVEAKAQQSDLTMQVLFRKAELLSISMYKDHSLRELSEAFLKGTLSRIAYESILESQRRRGLIDDTQVMLWKNG